MKNKFLISCITLAVGLAVFFISQILRFYVGILSPTEGPIMVPVELLFCGSILLVWTFFLYSILWSFGFSKISRKLINLFFLLALGGLAFTPFFYSFLIYFYLYIIFFVIILDFGWKKPFDFLIELLKPGLLFFVMFLGLLDIFCFISKGTGFISFVGVLVMDW
jgi:hypothetical protein